MEANILCLNLQETEQLWCDLRDGHAGRHRERWVASWSRDGDDVRWFNDDTGRYERSSGGQQIGD